MASAVKLDLSFPPETQETAKTELRETPDVVGPAILQLRKLVEEDKTITYDTSDEVLVRYLRPTKYYPESALALMKRCAEFSNKYSNILKDLVPDMVEKKMLEGVPVNVLVDRDQNGRRILVASIGKAWDTGKVSSDLIFQLFYLIHQAAMLEPQTAVNGVVVILDFEGLGLKQVANLTPKFALLLLNFIQECMPLRLKSVHIINEPMLFKAVWKIFQQFIKEKLNKRLYFHGSKREEILKILGADNLPKNYGGNLPEISYSSKDWYPVLKSVEDVIKANNKYGLAPKK